MSIKIIEGFTPNNYHMNEYNFQRIYAEEVLGAVWKLTFEEWCYYFYERGYLRDYPPVTTGRWVTRENKHMPFELGNIRAGFGPETGKPITTTYKWVNGRYVKHSVMR